MATFPRNTADTKPAFLATPTAIPFFDFPLKLCELAVSVSSRACFHMVVLESVFNYRVFIDVIFAYPHLIVRICNMADSRLDNSFDQVLAHRFCNRSRVRDLGSDFSRSVVFSTLNPVCIFD